MSKEAVKDIMIPISDYPSVSDQAVLAEVYLKLDEGHFKGDERTYEARAVLVKDGDGKVIGKVSQWDGLRALEPQYGSAVDYDRLAKFGFNPEQIKADVEKHQLWTSPLSSLCTERSNLAVEKFMTAFEESDYIDAGATPGEAIHALMISNKLSLMVTEGDEVIGILRLCDIFDVASRVMRECGAS